MGSHFPTCPFHILSAGLLVGPLVTIWPSPFFLGAYLLTDIAKRGAVFSATIVQSPLHCLPTSIRILHACPHFYPHYPRGLSNGPKSRSILFYQKPHSIPFSRDPVPRRHLQQRITYICSHLALHRACIRGG